MEIAIRGIRYVSRLTTSSAAALSCSIHSVGTNDDGTLRVLCNVYCVVIVLIIFYKDVEIIKATN